MRRKQKNILLPVLLFAAVLLLSVGGLVLAQNQHQARIEDPGEVVTQDDVPRVTPEEAYEAQQNQGAIIVDTRSEDQYLSQHIAGAINLPLDQLEVRIGELDPETWYITYCT